MPRVEERRLQQLRGSSYVLTLPKDWVEGQGLGKGASVLLLTDPGLLIVVPSERAGGTAVDVELDVVGERRLEYLAKVLYKIGVNQIRFRTREPIQQVMSRLRRLRREIHGLIVTAPSEHESLASFSDEVFASLEQGIRVFLMTLASAAQSAAKQTGSGETSTLQDELADCRLYALALFRHVSGMITRPSRDLVIQALPLAGVVSARMLDLCDAFEEFATRGGDVSSVVGTFAELVSELTDAVGGDHESLERVEDKLRGVVTGRILEDCRAYELFTTLSKATESIKELMLIKMTLSV
ncbi:MAG: AbrB/MazE/SpoVT family DNA-binding domain-containing protein [Nitrososphaerota archaeon]